MSHKLEELVLNKVERPRAEKILKKFPLAKIIGIGRHSVVMKQGDQAIKIEKDIPAAKGAIADEAKWLKFFNEHDIGPEFIEHNETLRYVIYIYVHGDFIPDFIARCEDPDIIRSVVEKCFEKCWKMDQLKVNKKEMHKPLKHIIVGDDVKFIDFERCFETKSAKNVTQLCDFFFISDRDLSKKIRSILGVSKDRAMIAVKSYKINPDLSKIMRLIEKKS